MPEFKEPTPKSSLEQSIDTLFAFNNQGKKIVDEFDKEIDPFREEPTSIEVKAKIFTDKLVPKIIALINTPLFKTEGLRAELELRLKEKIANGMNPGTLLEALKELTTVQEKVWKISERQEDIIKNINTLKEIRSDPESKRLEQMQSLGNTMQTINFIKGIVLRVGKLNQTLIDIKNEK